MADTSSGRRTQPSGGLSIHDLVNYVLKDSIPAKIGQDAASAFTLPGDVYAGRVDPNSDEGFDRVNKLAQMVTLGAAAEAPAVEDGLGMGIRTYKGMHPYQPDGSVIDLKQGSRYGQPHAGFYATNPKVANRFAEIMNGGSVYMTDIDLQNPYIIQGNGRHAADFQFGKAAEDWNKYLTHPNYENYDGIVLKDVKDAGLLGDELTDLVIPKLPSSVNYRFSTPETVEDIYNLPGGLTEAEYAKYFRRGGT